MNPLGPPPSDPPPAPPNADNSSSSTSSPRTPAGRKVKSGKHEKKSITHHKIKVAASLDSTPLSSDLRASGSFPNKIKLSKAQSLPSEGSTDTSEGDSIKLPLAASDSHVKVIKRRSSQIGGNTISHSTSQDSTPSSGSVSPSPIPEDVRRESSPEKIKQQAPIGRGRKASIVSEKDIPMMIKRENSVMGVVSNNLEYGEYAKLYTETVELKKLIKQKSSELSHAPVAEKEKLVKEIESLNKELKGKEANLNFLAIKLLNNKDEFKILLRDEKNHPIISALLAIRSTFLNEEGNKLLAKQLVETYSHDLLAKVLLYYVKKAIANTPNPSEALREVGPTMSVLMSMIQKKFMGPIVEKELTTICKKLEKEAPSDLKKWSQEQSNELSKNIFLKIHEVLITSKVPEPMQNLYTRIYSEFIKKWPNLEDKEKKGLTLVTSFFFLQLINPSIINGLRVNDVGSFSYKEDKSPIHAVQVTKVIQLIVNNSVSDKGPNKEIKELQPISHSIARNLMGRHKSVSP